MKTITILGKTYPIIKDIFVPLNTHRNFHIINYNGVECAVHQNAQYIFKGCNVHITYNNTTYKFTNFTIGYGTSFEKNCGYPQLLIECEIGEQCLNFSCGYIDVDKIKPYYRKHNIKKILE